MQSSVQNVIHDFDSKLNSVLKSATKPTVIKGVVHLLLILYASKIAPTPPQHVLDLFANVYFKLFVFSLILWTAQFNPSTAILIAVAFMVTINYSTSGKLWEHLENTSPEVAVQAAGAVLQAQVNNSQTVQGVSQNPNTIIITPTIVQTADGATVMNPSVVISPAVVNTPDGKQVVVKPDVSMLSPQAPNQTQPTTAITGPVTAVMTLAQAAASSSSADPTKMSQASQVAMSAVTSSAGANAVNNLTQQAIVAQAGDPAKVTNAVNVAISSMTPPQTDSSSTQMPGAKDKSSMPASTESSDDQSSGAGCYPMRNYDMSKVSGMKEILTDFEDQQAWPWPTDDASPSTSA